ncbi:MAG: ATP-binding protein [Rhodospirillaceae bacterium]
MGSPVIQKSLHRGSVRLKRGAAAALLGALGVAFMADRSGHHFTSQILLVAAAAFGGAVFGALHLRAQGRARTARPVLRAPTADELHVLAAIGCWEWDVRTDTFLWNDGMYALYGVSPGAFLPTKRSLLDFVAPQDIQRVLDTWAKDNESPPAGMIECRIVRPGGEQRHVRFSWHSVDPDGPQPKVFGLAQDITALKVARADDAQLRGMVACSADYIWEYRAGDAVIGGLRLQNLGADMSGAGKPALDAAGDHDFAVLTQAVGERAKFRDILVPVIDGRGEPRWVNLSGHPQFDGSGEYYGYRGVGADVTDRMRERDLEEGRRQAGAMGRLANGLAHEINNLLQPILIYSAFGADEAKQHEKLRLYFTRITRAAERATFIVKNVLAFARRTPPSREDINVLAVVRETVDLMSGAIGGHTHIEIAVSDDVPVARAERTGVAQIVTNLIANAADVMTSGGRIAVRVDRQNVSGEAAKAAGVAPGPYCRISVEDTGPGIAPDMIAKVFDPFFTTKPQGKGTGLGLAVVSGIAKSWGGGATVDSVPGQGCRFTVYLPAPERELLAAQ